MILKYPFELVPILYNNVRNFSQSTASYQQTFKLKINLRKLFINKTAFLQLHKPTTFNLYLNTFFLLSEVQTKIFFFTFYKKLQLSSKYIYTSTIFA